MSREQTPIVVMATELLQQIARGDATNPDQALEKFSAEVIRKAREICREDGYMPALFAINALLAYHGERERPWVYLPGPLPAPLADMEVSYLYDGEPATEYAYIRRVDDGTFRWFLTGDELELKTVYAYRSMAAPAPELHT